MRNFLCDSRQKVRVHGKSCVWKCKLRYPARHHLRLSALQRLPKLSTILFANDIKVWNISNEVVSHDLQADLDELVKWSQSLGLKFNSSKIELTHIRYGKSHQCTFSGTPLPQAQEQGDRMSNCDLSLENCVHCNVAAVKGFRLL